MLSTLPQPPPYRVPGRRRTGEHDAIGSSQRARASRHGDHGGERDGHGTGAFIRAEAFSWQERDSSDSVQFWGSRQRCLRELHRALVLVTVITFGAIALVALVALERHFPYMPGQRVLRGGMFANLFWYTLGQSGASAPSTSTILGTYLFGYSFQHMYVLRPWSRTRPHPRGSSSAGAGRAGSIRDRLVSGACAPSRHHCQLITRRGCAMCHP